MYTPKLGPVMAMCAKIKPGQSSDKDTQHLRDEYVRRGLLVWASLRLAVTVIWTGVVVIMTWKAYNDYCYQQESTRHTTARNVLMFGVFTTVLQLVEFGMIVTFIYAGVKKSSSLYRAYCRYCIVTLIIYVTSVTSCFLLKYEYGHYFREIYITFNFRDLVFIKNYVLVFGGAAILDICLEILLIRLIKRLINKYSYDEEITISRKFLVN